jgi:hypothetical protein
MDGLFVYGELMPQRQVSQGQRLTWPEQRGDKGQQDRDNGGHQRGPHHRRALIAAYVHRARMGT